MRRQGAAALVCTALAHAATVSPVNSLTNRPPPNSPELARFSASGSAGPMGRARLGAGCPGPAATLEVNESDRAPRWPATKP